MFGIKTKFSLLVIFYYITYYFIGFSSCQKLDTYDTAFTTQFSLNHLRSGDNTTFPNSLDNVTVNYNGTFPKTGLSFDSSYSRNQPYSFFVGMGTVIKCWDQVVKRMSLGERIYVVCPYNLAYGIGGSSNIPGSTDIAFDIDLLCIANNCYKQSSAVIIPVTNPQTFLNNTTYNSTKSNSDRFFNPIYLFLIGIFLIML